MKINKYLIWLLIIIGCGTASSNPDGQSSSSKEKTDLEKENLKGDVVLVIDNNTYAFFNEKGMHSKSILKMGDNLHLISTYYYVNNKANSVKTTSVENPNFKKEAKFFYDENGTLNKMVEDSASVIKYVHDKDNNLVEELESIYGVEHSIKYFYSNNILDSSHSKFLNTIKSERISYYQNGNLIKIVGMKIDDNSKHTFTITYEYLYDSQGNWIQQKSFIDGKEDKIINRKIFYKGQDISKYESEYNEFIARIDNQSSNNSNSAIENNNSNSNNNTSNTYQEQEKPLQWVNCRDCQGQGIIICRDCTGRGSKKCSYCFGRGWKWYGTEKENCNTCGGTGDEKCQRCYGKGNQGRCNSCSGRGQVQMR